MFVASVESRRSSSSLYACFWLVPMAMTPMVRSLAGIGTPTYDSVSLTLNGAPMAAASSAVETRIGRPVARIRAVSSSPRTFPSISRWRTPWSSQYRNLTVPVSGSSMAIDSPAAPRASLARSPTASMIDSKSSWRARAWPTSLTMLSSASSSAIRPRVRASSAARSIASAPGAWVIAVGRVRPVWRGSGRARSARDRG